MSALYALQRFQVHVFDKLKLPSIYNTTVTCMLACAAAACRSIMYASLCDYDTNVLGALCHLGERQYT